MRRKLLGSVAAYAFVATGVAAPSSQRSAEIAPAPVDPLNVAAPRADRAA